MRSRRHRPLDSKTPAGSGSGEHLVVAARPRFRDRIAARLASHRLDLALAAGVPAETSPALALRARQLRDFEERRALAGSIRRLVGQAEPGRPHSSARIIPSVGHVTAARDALGTLADALADPRPVRVRGVAQARLLLTDATWPLYNPRCERTLRTQARVATENLELRIE
ncbi:MAG: hypothetical protein JO153_12865 [Solirubrobacterales bacterium]|nr:hypothetical protein [Solirubrobacterales bacterium]